MFRTALIAATLALAGCTTSSTSGEPQTTTQQTSWNTAALAEVTAYVQSQKTTGFLIIQDGKTIAEHNWPLPDDPASQTFKANFVHGVSANGALREDVASQQKSLIALLVGVGIDKGLIDIERPVSDYIVTQLWFTKVGDMHSTGWEQRPAVFADVGNPTGLVTTPRDLAIMGQVVLDGGRKPNGSQLISKAQLDAILTPTSTNPAYGRLWWLNDSAYSLNAGANTPRREGRFIPSAPSDMVSALGASDRKLFVVPSQKLIVVRTGQAAPDRDFNEKLWNLLAKAAPRH
jgi:CubicO group peptidase (beta-lactamase class C family)